MGLEGPEIFVILIIVLLLFGGKKIPELMRGLGKGVKEFKDSQDPSKDVKEPAKEEPAPIKEEEKPKD